VSSLYFFYKTQDKKEAIRRRCEKEREDYLEKHIKEIVEEALLEYYSGNIPKEDEKDHKESTYRKEPIYSKKRKR